MNDFSSKCEILGDLWLSYKGDDAFEDFMEYNDIGLPIAYAISAGLVKAEPQGELYVNETWDLLLDSLGADESVEYESLDDLLDGYVEE